MIEPPWFERDRTIGAEPPAGRLEVALLLYKDGPADYSDCVHIALAAEAGEQPLWTFDARAAKVAGARLLTK
jgi:predicted nucleic acid-binding protein